MRPEWKGRITYAEIRLICHYVTLSDETMDSVVENDICKADGNRSEQHNSLEGGTLKATCWGLSTRVFFSVGAKRSRVIYSIV